MTDYIQEVPGPGPEPAGLGKTLLPRHIEMISIGGIIGAGLFVGSSAAIARTGPAIVLSYLLAGALIFFVMRMLAEMATSRADITTLADFPRAALGNWAGFTAGWLYWYFWVVVVAIEAIAGAVLISHWIPVPVWIIGIGLMAVMTLINLMSARAFGEFEFWFSSLKVAAILAFIVITAAYAFGLTSGAGPTFHTLTDFGGFAPTGWSTVLAGVTTVVFSLCGAEIATIAAAESPNPAKVIGKLTVSVIARILLFYVLSILLIVSVVPWNAVVPGESPFALALTRMNIPFAGLAMNIIVLVAVLSCLNSGLYVTSRVLFSLAERGDAPKFMVKVNARKVPFRAILIASSFGFVTMFFSVVSPKTVFAFLVSASGAIMLIVYLLVCFAQIRMRRVTQRENPSALTIKMWLFPGLTYVVAAAMIAVLVAMLFEPDLAVQLYATLGSAVVVLAAYAFRSKYGAKP
jgi:L-asparagine transporter-like permease